LNSAGGQSINFRSSNADIMTVTSSQVTAIPTLQANGLLKVLGDFQVNGMSYLNGGSRTVGNSEMIGTVTITGNQTTSGSENCVRIV
jgi:hypothetical protein